MNNQNKPSNEMNNTNLNPETNNSNNMNNQDKNQLNPNEMNNSINDFNQEIPKVKSLDLNDALFNENSSQNKEIMHNPKLTSNMPTEGEKSVSKETNALETRKEQNQEIDNFYTQQMDRKFGLIERITERSMFEQIQKNKAELMKTSAQYRLSFYKTIMDTQLEALTEKCNAGLKMIKAEYRQQVSSFVMQKLEQLAFDIKDRQIRFMEMMKDKYAYAKTLEVYPSMLQNYTEKMFNEEKQYLDLLESLMNKFGSLVNEELKKY